MILGTDEKKRTFLKIYSKLLYIQSVYTDTYKTNQVRKSGGFGFSLYSSKTLDLQST